MSRNGKVTPTRVKQFRAAQDEMSAYDLACALGYTRSYVKSIEGGSLRITRRFAQRFARLERKTYAKAKRERRIQSIHPLPMEVKILARPRRCRICKEWFIFPHPLQRVCTGRDCRHQARRRTT